MKHACLLLLLASCAEPAGVDLALVPDPNVNSAAQVVEAVDSIVMIADSPEGLYPPGAERASGVAQIENADGDPELELVATIAMPADRLPLIRLVEGTLPDLPLELRFLGMPPEPGAPSVAIGRVQGVRLGQPIERLDVPFNLRPELLPPRITEVLPNDGAMLAGCDVPAIYLMFSRPIDPATVAGAVFVNPGTIGSVRVDPSGLTAEILVSGLSGDGSSVRYGLSVAPTITDLDGRPLDQVPGEEGAQGYDSQLELLCGPGTALPTTACGSPDIGPLAPTCEYFRLTCVDGYCVPLGCDGASCTDGTVCDGQTSRCELDCRLWGEANVCPIESPRCDAASGTCVP
jgi:hypothetical protein